MPSRSRLALSALAGLAIAFATPAAAEFVVTIQNLETDRAEVLVDATQLSYGPCPALGCRRAVCYANVTPCPPGAYCPDGVNAPFSILASPVEMTLLYQTDYVFTGEWVAETGPRVDNMCTFSCTHHVPVTTTTYNLEMPPEGPEAQVVVTPLEISGVNTWVRTGLTPDVRGGCNGNCPYLFGTLTMSPCPLEARSTNQNEVRVDCINGVASFILFWNQADPDLELLLAPGSYLFTANTTYIVFMTDNAGNPCHDDKCQFLGSYGPNEFTTSPLATIPITWGRIKALYRN